MDPEHSRDSQVKFMTFDRKRQKQLSSETPADVQNMFIELCKPKVYIEWTRCDCLVIGFQRRMYDEWFFFFTECLEIKLNHICQNGGNSCCCDICPKSLIDTKLTEKPSAQKTDSHVAIWIRHEEEQRLWGAGGDETQVIKCETQEAYGQSSWWREHEREGR